MQKDNGVRFVGGGEALASMDIAMSRLAEFVQLAEQGRMDELHARIERYTLETQGAGTNQVIFGVAMILASMRAGTGRSMIPVIKAAERHWSRGMASLYKIWTP